jgi:hypothetical protein
LWSGNVCDKNRALQFLWIVDIIKFWAEYTFKPFMGACLTHIEAEINNHDKVPLEETPWKYHIALNQQETPFFFQATSSHFTNSQPHNAAAADGSYSLCV